MSSYSPSEQSDGGVPLVSPRTPHGLAPRRSPELKIEDSIQKPPLIPKASAGQLHNAELQQPLRNPWPPRQVSAEAGFHRRKASGPSHPAKAEPRHGYRASSGPSYYPSAQKDKEIDELTQVMTKLEITLHPDHQTANFQIRALKQRVNGLLQEVYRHIENVPPVLAQVLEFDLKEASQSLSKIAMSIDKLARHLELKMAECDRVQATAGVQAVDIERLRHELEAARRETHTCEKTSEEVQKTYQDVIRSMEEQNRRENNIKTFDEQLQPKDHLLYPAVGHHESRETGPIGMPQTASSGARRASGSNTPATDFMSLSVSTRVAASSPLLPASCIPSRPSSSFTAPHHPRYDRSKSRNRSVPRSNGPGGVTFRSSGSTQYNFDDNQALQLNNARELGSPIPSRGRPPHQLQRYLPRAPSLSSSSVGPVANTPGGGAIEPADPMVTLWKSHFARVFSMVQGWCNRYAKEVRPGDVTTIQMNAPKLWDYVSDILYPGQPESGASHAAFLLQEPGSRPCVVERVLLQYIVNTMFSVEAFADFREDIDAKLAGLQHQLRQTDRYKTFERQSIIDQMAKLINLILVSEDFNSFRQRRESFHQQRLKTIAGPLVDGACSRADAGFDLHSIAGAALQVAANMFQSRLGFHFLWSDTCAKFSAEAHNARGTHLDPATLQLKQWRLKLVISPGVILRDERGPQTVAPRRVLKSDVLVMN